MEKFFKTIAKCAKLNKCIDTNLNIFNKQCNPVTSELVLVFLLYLGAI